MKKDNLAILEISYDNLLRFIQGKIKLLDDLPKDVECIGVYECWERQCFRFKLRHPSFTEVTQGQCLPVIQAYVTTIDEPNFDKTKIS